MEWKSIFNKLLQKTWNPNKQENLFTLWRGLSGYNGLPKMNEISKLRKLASLITTYCNTKTSIPIELAPAIAAIEKEGIADTADTEFGKPKYLGFVHFNSPSDEYGGSFWFKVEVTKSYPMGYNINEGGQRVMVYQKKKGWDFLRLSLKGNTNVPNPTFKTEELIDQNWTTMKADKGITIITGSPKKIKFA